MSENTVATTVEVTLSDISTTSSVDTEVVAVAPEAAAESSDPACGQIIDAAVALDNNFIVADPPTVAALDASTGTGTVCSLMYVPRFGTAPVVELVTTAPAAMDTYFDGREVFCSPATASVADWPTASWCSTVIGAYWIRVDDGTRSVALGLLSGTAADSKLQQAMADALMIALGQEGSAEVPSNAGSTTRPLVKITCQEEPTPEYADLPIGLGSEGPLVTMVQQMLTSVGIFIGRNGADGRYGTDLQSAMFSFQLAQERAYTTGGVCMEDIRMLQAAVAATTAATTTTTAASPTTSPVAVPFAGCQQPTEGIFEFPIRPGDSGETVRAVQELLVLLGYDIGASGADGHFGPATEAAVRLFKGTGTMADGATLCMEDYYLMVQSTESY